MMAATLADNERNLQIFSLGQRNVGKPFRCSPSGANGAFDPQPIGVET